MSSSPPSPAAPPSDAAPGSPVLAESPTSTSPVDWTTSDSPTSMSGDFPSFSPTRTGSSSRPGSRPKPAPASLLCPPATIISPPSPVEPMDGLARFGSPDRVPLNDRSGHGQGDGPGDCAVDGARDGGVVMMNEAESTEDSVFASGHALGSFGLGKGRGSSFSSSRSGSRSRDADRSRSPGAGGGAPSPLPLAATHMSNSPKFMSPSKGAGQLPDTTDNADAEVETNTPGTPPSHVHTPSHTQGQTRRTQPDPHRGHAHRDSLVPPGSRDYFSPRASSAGSPSPAGSPSASGLVPTPLPLSPRSPTPSSPGFHPRSPHGLGHRRLSSTHRVRESKGEQRASADGERMVNQYKFAKELGKGMFAKVELAVDVGTGAEYAVKEFSQSRLHTQSLQEKHRQAARGRLRAAARGRGRGAPAGAGTALRDPTLSSPENGPADEAERQAEADTVERGKEDPLALIRREIAVMKKLDHPNIVLLYEAIAVRSADALFLVLEYMPGGVLMDVHLGTQPKEPPFPVDQAREYFRQLCLGLEYLHANEVLHRDIKPENILLSKDRQIVKLCDFGVSELFVASNDDRVKKSGGSPAFLSPESLQGSGANVHGKLVDIYALGVTLYCMLTGGLPFNTENPLELFERVQNEDAPIPEDWPPEQKEIVTEMLRKDPSFRMHMFIIRDHPWVTEHGAHPMIERDENLYEVGKFVEEPTQEELSSAIGALRGVFTVIRAVQKMRRLQLNRRSISSAGSNPASPPPRNKQFSTDGEGSALSLASGSMDSYSSDRHTEGTDGTDTSGGAREGSRWHTEDRDGEGAGRERVDSPRRMDSGYADEIETAAPASGARSGESDERKQGGTTKSGAGPHSATNSREASDREIPHLDLSSLGRSSSGSGSGAGADGAPLSPDSIASKRKREVEEAVGRLRISTDVRRPSASASAGATSSARTATQGSDSRSRSIKTPSSASTVQPGQGQLGLQMMDSPIVADGDGDGHADADRGRSQGQGQGQGDDVQMVDSPVEGMDDASVALGRKSPVRESDRGRDEEQGQDNAQGHGQGDARAHGADGEWEMTQSPVDGAGEEVSIFDSPVERD